MASDPSLIGNTKVNKVLYCGEMLIDITNASVKEEYVLEPKTFYKTDGNLANGTMPNNGAITNTISTKDEIINIPIGYHDGNGSISISDTEKEKIISENIREGVSILGIGGTVKEVKLVTVILSVSSINACGTDEKIYYATPDGQYNCIEYGVTKDYTLFVPLGTIIASTATNWLTNVKICQYNIYLSDAIKIGNHGFIVDRDFLNLTTAGTEPI